MKSKNQITLELLSKTAIELARFRDPQENPLRRSPLEDALSPSLLNAMLKKYSDEKQLIKEAYVFLRTCQNVLDESIEDSEFHSNLPKMFATKRIRFGTAAAHIFGSANGVNNHQSKEVRKFLEHDMASWSYKHRDDFEKKGIPEGLIPRLKRDFDKYRRNAKNQNTLRKVFSAKGLDTSILD